MSQLSPFRITPEDLPDLDQKTLAGIQPLLDALNVSVQQLVYAAQAQQSSVTTSGTLSTDGAGDATVTIKPQTTSKPFSVQVDQIRLVESTEDLSAVYSFSWQLIGDGIRGVFHGLAADTKYAFTITYQ